MTRPSIYTEQVAETICSRIAGGEPLTRICKSADMPGYTTVMRWLSSNEAFRVMYTRAKEDQADTLADEIIDIADGVTKARSAEQVAAARLRVDARKWTAAKLKPRKYGERTVSEIVGDGGGPVKTEAIVNVEAGEAYLRMLNGNS